ncbi:TadE/TadG family type IV pilus assembly protein [Chloroflexota bacterium]
MNGNTSVDNAKGNKPVFKGQSLVEFAISLTLLLTLLAGAFDFGMAFLDYVALREAAQEGVIFGSVEPDQVSDIVERVRQSSDRPIDFSTFVYSADCTNLENGICVTVSSPCSGGEITVRVNYRYHITMPFIGGIIGSESIPLHATVSNVILSPLCP